MPHLPSLNSIISRLHVKQLRLLIALNRLGSLASAATAVGLTQSGASKALQDIESTFATPLFRRTSRGLEPTLAGHTVLKYAQLIHTDLAHLHDELDAILHRGVGGRVSVGTIMGAVPLLTRAVSSLLQRQSEMSVEIVEDTSASLLADLESGRLDLGICRTSVTQTPHAFDSTVIQNESLVVIANRRHPLVASGATGASGAAGSTIEQLATYRWIVYRANMPMRLLLEREFQRANVRFPRYLIETTSPLATVSLLQRNPDFVALVSTEVADFFVENGLMTALPLSLSSPSEPYELVTRHGAHMSAAAILLRDELLGIQPSATQG